jgi:intracellular multiplication protein IcmC
MVTWQNIFINLSHSYPQLENLIRYTAYVMGVVFMLKGVYAFRIYGEMRNMMSQQHSIRGPLTFLLVGSALMFLPSMQNVLVTTAFGSPDLSPFSYMTSQGWTTEMATAIFGFVRIIGYIAFIRGWVIIAGSAQGHGQNSTAKGLIHIFGGILAINIIGTQQLLWNTLGLS